MPRLPFVGCARGSYLTPVVPSVSATTPASLTLADLLLSSSSQYGIDNCSSMSLIGMSGCKVLSVRAVWTNALHLSGYTLWLAHMRLQGSCHDTDGDHVGRQTPHRHAAYDGSKV